MGTEVTRRRVEVRQLVLVTILLAPPRQNALSGCNFAMSQPSTGTIKCRRFTDLVELDCWVAECAKIDVVDGLRALGIQVPIIDFNVRPLNITSLSHLLPSTHLTPTDPISAMHPPKKPQPSNSNVRVTSEAS